MHFHESVVSVDSSDHPSHPFSHPLSLAVHNALAADALTSVESALLKFQQAAEVVTPSVPFVFASSASPTIFTTPTDFDASYAVWILLPIPNVLQISALRAAIASTPGAISIQLTRDFANFYLPVWILEHWARLRTLIAHCRDWARSKLWLLRIAQEGVEDNEEIGPGLALDVLERLPTTPLDMPIPSLSPFRTSDLSGLLGDIWLSDDHINAACDFINNHPDCAPQIRVLSSFFLGVLSANLQRTGAWNPHHPIALDSLVLSSTVTELLIPFHRPSHWTFIYVNISDCTYAYCDSLGPNQLSLPQESTDPLNRWLSCILGGNIVLQPAPRPFLLNLQTDYDSCGVAVVSTMAHRALGGTFRPWSQSCSNRHRINWAMRLLGSIASTLDGLDGTSDMNFTSEGSLDMASQSDDVISISSESSSDFEVMSVDTDIASNSSDEVVRSRSVVSQAQTLTSITSGSGSAFGSDESVGISRPMIQSVLPFKTIARSEWLTQETRRYHDSRAEYEGNRERLELAKTRAQLQHRKYERLRKRTQREWKKRAREALREAKLGSSQDNAHISASSSSQSVASLSRPYRLPPKPKRANPCGRKTVNEPKAASRVNWTSPFLWSQIQSAADAVGYPWSPTAIVRRLRNQDPQTFALLRPQRISQWRDHSYTDVLRWTDSHLRAINAGNRPRGGANHTSVLNDRPDIRTTIESRLSQLRTAGIPLDLATIRGYMVGIITHLYPEAFTRLTATGQPFRCSESFATRAAQKQPANIDQVLLHAFLRLVCVIRDEDIPACCIVNADQTQVVYNMGSQSTWCSSGARQVNVLGVEEKRAFTLLVSASMSGDVLPFQAIYGGKSPRSLPDPQSPGFARSAELGFSFEYTETATYWSTQQTMQSFVVNILVPYFVQQRALHQLPESQRCILQIDCWAVHRSAEFRTWMSTNYPWIVIQYVPGGCTGLFQACDVGLQRILKLAIRHAAHADIVSETTAALEAGTAPEDIVNDQTRPTLRNRSVRWILQGYEAINKPEIVKKAFSLCIVPGSEFNLSYESLASRTARQELLNLRSTDPSAYAKITSGSDTALPADVGGDPEPEGHTNTCNEDLIENDPADDSDLTVEELSNAFLLARLVPVAECKDSEEASVPHDSSRPDAPHTTRYGRASRAPARYTSTRPKLSRH